MRFMGLCFVDLCLSSFSLLLYINIFLRVKHHTEGIFTLATADLFSISSVKASFANEVDITEK